jgi:heme/copper-type cytochrome/quinol oxidase subunit 3
VATHSTTAQHPSHLETTTGLDHRKLLMWTFLASECLFFGSLIATFLLFKDAAVVGPYPHEVLNIPVTSTSTFVLLTSSLSMVLALAAIQRGDIVSMRVWIMATAVLGATFLGFQVFEFQEFIHEGLKPSTNVFGASFFTLTGFHGAHVAVGVIWLMSLFIYSFKSKDRILASKSLDVELAGLYWHFVDIVWVVIFTVVYLISSLE